MSGDVVCPGILCARCPQGKGPRCPPLPCWHEQVARTAALTALGMSSILLWWSWYQMRQLDFVPQIVLV